LICRLWQGLDGKRLDAAWVQRYLPSENTLYQIDIYMGSEPKPITHLALSGSKGDGAA
jgi:hypothetical protein